MENISTDIQFNEIASNHKGLIIIDFWAPWCAPCKQFLPVFSAVADKMSDSVKFLKINIDENPETPSRFGVRSIPTLVAISSGNHLETKVGSLSEEDLISWVELHMNK